MNIGKMRRRVTLQKQTTIRDEGIEIPGGWSDVATVWAAVEPITLGLRKYEHMAAAAIQVENSVLIRIRYREGITSDMRVAYRDRIFDIQGIADIDERHKEMHLMCKEVRNGG